MRSFYDGRRTQKGRSSLIRAGDKRGATHFQSDRFFVADGEWYFATRETSEQGPFGTKGGAEKALMDYLKVEVGIVFPTRDPWDDPSMRR